VGEIERAFRESLSGYDTGLKECSFPMIQADEKGLLKRLKQEAL